jgi:DNA-binding response OmpR family regulator
MTCQIPAKAVPTILLVDDNENVLRRLHNYLEEHGYNVLEAQVGDEALLIAECYPGMIHVLVIDLIMPRLTGSEFLRLLLPLHPETEVIMMSVFPNELMEDQGLTLLPILEKPFSPKRLLNALQDVLANPQPEHTVANLVQTKLAAAEQLDKAQRTFKEPDQNEGTKTQAA